MSPFIEMKKHLPAIFQDEDQIYVADTCEELKQSSLNQDVHVRAWSHPPYPGKEVDDNYIPEIRSIGLWDIREKQSWGLKSHCNEGLEFSFLASGQVDFGVDGQQWALKSGQIAITRPWQFHQIGNPNITPSRLYWLILDVNVRRPNKEWQWPDWFILSRQELSQLTDLLRHNEQPIWDTNPEIAGIFEKLMQLVETDRAENNETKLKLYVNELLLALFNLLLTKDVSINSHLSTSERVVDMFLKALKKHLSYAWSLESMAHQCGLSRSQFSTYCRTLTNMSPIQYLNHCRMESALEMLRADHERHIGEIAEACGFNSLQYFSTIFKKLQGCSPKDYRAR